RRARAATVRRPERAAGGSRAARRRAASGGADGGTAIATCWRIARQDSRRRAVSQSLTTKIPQRTGRACPSAVIPSLHRKVFRLHFLPVHEHVKRVFPRRPATRL